MLEQLLAFVTPAYTIFQEQTKNNPVMAGVVSLWGLTILTLFCKTVPARIFDFIKRQSITSVQFNNTRDNENHLNFNAFMAWYASTPYLKFSRMLSIESGEWDKEARTYKSIVGPGVGLHFFFYKWRLYWFNFNKLDSQGSETEKREIVINTLGRSGSQACILDLIETFKYVSADNTLKVYTPDGGYWNNTSSLKKRLLKSTIIEPTVKNDLISNLDFMEHNREYYETRGLPYKKTILLHGMPGTGKTSIISAMASKYDKNLCIMNLANCTDNSFERLFQTVPDNSYVIIEDFDTVSATSKRGTTKQTKPKQTSDSPGIGSVEFGINMLNLTTILNSLDGIVRLDNVVVFLTTNHIEKIDDALLRKGRIDHTYQINYLQHDQIVEYIHLMYPDCKIPKVRFTEKAGCDVQAAFMETKTSDEFIERLLE